jgi:uncharacterized protein
MSLLDRQERIDRTRKFLARLVPCVREVIWLNPLPLERWAGTTAEAIQGLLSGRMVPFEAKRWEALVRSRQIRTGVQKWSVIQK